MGSVMRHRGGLELLSAHMNFEGPSLPGSLFPLCMALLTKGPKAHQRESSFLKSFYFKNFYLQLPESQGKQMNLDSLRMNSIVAFPLFCVIKESTRLNDMCKQCP